MNKTKITPALGALMHFYSQQPNGGVNKRGTFGLSIHNNTHLNYHGWLSLLFGNQQRIVLSSGATLSKVKPITDDHQVGGTIPISVGAVPTGGYFRWGWFISFTYHLSQL